MITKIHYKNFKALRDAILPLGCFTLIVGANGTGKSTAMQAIKAASDPISHRLSKILTAGLSEDVNKVELIFEWSNPTVEIKSSWGERENGITYEEYFVYLNLEGKTQLPQEFLPPGLPTKIERHIRSFRIFSFEASAIAQDVELTPNVDLNVNGSNLAGVLDRIRDEAPERFEDLNRELKNWFPEFDRILFETPRQGTRSFLLRARNGHHKIKATDLSQGTLTSLAFLATAYLPDLPKFVCFEEPEKGVHPRLLRNIQEAMDRLAYPENFGEKREPVQVIATTHSPYLLDLYKDRREEIVIADKDENGVHFNRLIDLPHIEEILKEQDAPLGDIWFSGVLGGVPA